MFGGLEFYCVSINREIYDIALQASTKANAAQKLQSEATITIVTCASSARLQSGQILQTKDAIQCRQLVILNKAASCLNKGIPA